MARGGSIEIVHSGLQRLPLRRRQRAARGVAQDLTEYLQKSLDSAMTIGQQPQRLVKTVQRSIAKGYRHEKKTSLSARRLVVQIARGQYSSTNLDIKV